MREELPQFNLMDKLKVGKNEAVFDASDTPAIIMFNPKYPHNVGAAVRSCSCFDSSLLMFTGDRLIEELRRQKGKRGYRLPREERMKGYQDVQIFNDDYPFNRFSRDVVPVAIEVRANAEYLPNFPHPPNAVYVFGPEDGSIPQIYLKHCQRFVYIPSNHCLNLANAINVVLYDRMAKSNFTSANYIKMLEDASL